MRWTKDVKLGLNTEKSQTATFTMEVRWSTKIKVESKSINHVSTPRLLGGYTGPKPLLSPTCQPVTTRMASRSKIIEVVTKTRKWDGENSIW